MTNMEDFYTRPAANEGIKLPLQTADGKETDQWIMIRGVDSDEFRRANTAAKRNIIRVVKIEDEAERAAMVEQESKALCASLVKSWSFEQECTPANVIEFLTNAPRIADQIERVSAENELFLAARLSNSLNTQKPKSRSTKSRKAQKQQGDNS